jgi:hypothetical protein
VTKDLITRAKEQNYMALPKLPSGSFVDNYNYDPAGDVETLPDINNESPTSDYLKYNGKLAPRF